MTGKRAGEQRRNRRFLVAAVLIACILFSVTMTHGQMAQASDHYETVVRYRSVEVKEGDTLWNLAKEYGAYQDSADYIDEVKRVNQLKGDTIHAGAYLMLPYEETLFD